MLGKPRRSRTSIILLAVSGIAFTVITYPRFVRCLAYHQIVSQTEAALNLSPQPTPLAVDGDAEAIRFSIGYADIGLPSDWATAISILGSEQIVIRIMGHADGAIVFMPPFFDAQLSADGNYSWMRTEASTQRVPLADVFRMPKSEYEELLSYTLPKSFNRYNQNGIGGFSTDHVRGFIRFGPRDEPGNVLIEVWSNRGKLSQGILIFAPDAETAERLTQVFLANLRYSIDEVPAEEVLQAMIRGELEGHALLSETADD